MADKSQKVAKLLLLAGGAAVGIFLIAKYRKSVIQKFSRIKNRLTYEYALKSNFKIEIINNPEECDKFIALLRQHCEEYPTIGFDCEWVTVNSERRKIALIQLCSSQGLCGLIRVCKFPKIPLELRKLLEDSDVIKAGVTPSSDAKYLLQDYAIKMNGTFDLRFLALLAKHKAEGLGKLSKSILDIELDKDWHIRCSDWEIQDLSPKQIDYAAKDAFVAVEIFLKLYNLIRPTASDTVSIRRFCDNYTDITFKNKLAQLNLDPATASKKKLLKSEKELTKLLKRSYTPRTGPYYHNCRLEAPDGDLLCTCDRKKAEWYVKQGRGTVVSDEPFTVRLSFEPSGRSVGEVGEYYRTPRDSICVVCGKTEDLIRKNVVPHEYRKFFPTIMKSKTSHDVLLLCVHCHQCSNIGDLKMRQKLQNKCDAPLNGVMSEEDIEAKKKLMQEQRWANALINVQVLPEKRKVELKKLLETAYPDQEINEEFLTNLLSKQSVSVSIHAPSHGEMVVKRFRETEGLVELEKIWRQHFIDLMEPKFMPKLWDLNHNTNRLGIRANEGRVTVDELKESGVNAIVVPKINSGAPEPIVIVTAPVDEPDISNANNDDDNVSIDTSSDWEFRSAAGSRNSSAKVDLDKTITDDHYFSDANSVQSFYETIRSEGSTLDDFQSFASSLTEQANYDSDDGSRTSLGSQDLSIDSDREVEDDPAAKMEM